jgi:hypothetical protein
VRLRRIFLLSVAGLVLGYNLSPLLPGRGVEQPLSFNHQIHRVMDCTLCHAGAKAGVKAGFPEAEVCQKCHAISPLADIKYQEVWKQAESGNQLLWNKLAKVPEHVYFSHNRHVHLAGLNCQQCHGMISTTARPPSSPLMKISMGSCLNCHLENNVSQDCAACHR